MISASVLLWIDLLVLQSSPDLAPVSKREEPLVLGKSLLFICHVGKWDALESFFASEVLWVSLLISESRHDFKPAQIREELSKLSVRLLFVDLVLLWNAFESTSSASQFFWVERLTLEVIFDECPLVVSEVLLELCDSLLLLDLVVRWNTVVWIV